jgi:hypothetical protein
LFFFGFASFFCGLLFSFPFDDILHILDIDILSSPQDRHRQAFAHTRSFVSCPLVLAQPHSAHAPAPAHAHAIHALSIHSSRRPPTPTPASLRSATTFTTALIRPATLRRIYEFKTALGPTAKFPVVDQDPYMLLIWHPHPAFPHGNPAMIPN